MDAAVQRCKTIVSGILMSAGEARGEAPRLTTMRAFLTATVEDSRAVRLPGSIEFNDLFGADVPIVSDPALRQVIGNVLDNARSEEHTSELQSLMRISYAVFCLKKKTQVQNSTADIHK